MVVGRLFATSGVISCLASDDGKLFEDDLLLAVSLFAANDWGDVCEEDSILNDLAAAAISNDPYCGQRCLGSYKSVFGTVWVVGYGTQTTVLFPDEY